MYFKQLEIVGFKSFPNKTKLKFEPGVTAVVGPNGCGKSNIADAIKWVLGEQAPKSLRGSSMEDVIFNGTASIEPINVAEVSLTLSNEKRLLPIDYNEVTITRRLHRSGESEYLLNKTNVRLKDISTLLMGTGMGTSSYSIIEQGKIDLILSSRPEERRYIFEEASGITKYKSKKREAMRKLEHTENNLVRINDIITEVRRQINSVERHAKKAERYKTHFEEMKELDLKQSAYELGNISKELQENVKHLETITTEESTLRSELEEASTLITRYREELDSVILGMTNAQEKRTEAVIHVDRCEHKVTLNTERISDLKNIKENSQGELNNLKEKIESQETEIDKTKSRFEELVNTKEEKEKTLSQKEETVENLSHHTEALQREIKKAKNSTVDLLAFQTKTKNELIKLGADLQNRRSRVRRLQTEKENVEKEKDNVKSQLDTVAGELNICQKRVEEKKNSLGQLKNDFGLSEQELEDIKNEILKNVNDANALKSKAEVLREMIRNFEGFDKGVKAIMEAVKSGVLNGIIGTVADMLAPETGYEWALEAILDKKAQAIVVKDKEALKEAIGFLGQKGSAHFIVLDDIAYGANYNRNRAFMQKNQMPELSSLVKTDPNFTYLAQYLLDDIYVAENQEAAEEVLKRCRNNIKIVTKDGFFIEKGHVFGGVASDESTSSIIGREKKLDEILDRENKLRRAADELRMREQEKRKSLEVIKEEILSKEEVLKKDEIELANILSRKESVEGSLTKIEDEVSIVQLEISEVDELIHEVSLRGDDLNKQLNEKENEYSKMQEFITTSQNEIQEKTKVKNDTIFEISEIKSEISFLINTENQEARNLDKDLKTFEEIKAQYDQKDNDARNCDEKIKSLEEEKEKLLSEIEIKKKEEADLTSKLNEIQENKKTISQELREKEVVMRKKEKTAQNLKDHIRNYEIKNRENELRLVNIKDRVREAYKLDIATTEIQIPEDVNWEDIKNQIEVLKIKLDKIGPVNLVAIDEHKELEERFSFLTQQQEDLLRAKESLHKAIIKINRTTKQLFIEAFQKIQVEFKDYFRMLFGGGHAELLLVDESDVLESGIEIVVRPPGKKLQNLLLLSGGEKALTAIALLFAIFKVKPSPFCILDEVDAPLDESNIGRFTRILQEFLKTSQFIVITHNKRTMQMADVLYGITMQNKGVSKIVSVKFADNEKEPPPAKAKEEVLV